MLYEEDLGKDCPDFPNWAALCTRVDLTVAPMEEPSKKLNPSYPPLLPRLRCLQMTTALLWASSGSKLRLNVVVIDNKWSIQTDKSELLL